MEWYCVCVWSSTGIEIMEFNTDWGFNLSLIGFKLYFFFHCCVVWDFYCFLGWWGRWADWFVFGLFLIADMGIRLWWRILRGDGGILFSIRYGQFLVLEYDFFFKDSIPLNCRILINVSLFQIWMKYWHCSMLWNVLITWFLYCISNLIITPLSVLNSKNLLLKLKEVWSVMKYVSC